MTPLVMSRCIDGSNSIEKQVVGLTPVRISQCWVRREVMVFWAAAIFVWVLMVSNNLADELTTNLADELTTESKWIPTIPSV